MLCQAVVTIPQPALLMPVLIPVLCQRLGATTSHEPSEEVRLRLVRLMAAFTASAAPALEQHASSLTVVICAALADPFPDIKKVCTTHLHAHVLAG